MTFNSCAKCLTAAALAIVCSAGAPSVPSRNADQSAPGEFVARAGKVRDLLSRIDVATRQVQSARYVIKKPQARRLP
jgi:hypothetical protein